MDSGREAGPIKVLNVVGAMNRGGIETWLMNIARNLDPQDVELTFLKHHSLTSDYDEEIIALGHQIAVCPSTRHRPWEYARLLRIILRDHGPFDVLHSYVSNFSALPLYIARTCGVPIRIAHSQTDRRRSEKGAGAVRRVYLALSRRLILASMTAGLGCSDEACLSLFGRLPGEDDRIMWMPNGIDLLPFADAKGTLRDELGIGDETLLVGHVGRFVPVKNHRRLLDVAEECRRQERDLRLVMIGDGPMRAAVEDRLMSEVLGDVATCMGLRSDIPAVMRSLDVLVLPSLHEGVPIVMLEAQACGVPCVVSDRVSRVSDVIPELVTRVDVESSAVEWIAAIYEMSGRRISVDAAQKKVAASEWSLSRVLKRLRWHWTGGASESPVEPWSAT